MRSRLITNSIIFAGSAAFVAAAVTNVAGSDDTTATERTVTVTEGDIVESVSATGSTTSAGSLDLSFAGSGTIATVEVAVGDRVAAGDVLATLETDAASRQIAQAEAGLAGAQAQLAKLRQGLTAEQEHQLDASEAQSQAQHAAARSALDRQRATAAHNATLYDLQVAQAQENLRIATEDLDTETSSLAEAEQQLADDTAGGADAATIAADEAAVDQALIRVESANDTVTQRGQALDLAEQNRVVNLSRDAQSVTAAEQQVATAAAAVDSVRAQNSVQQQGPRAADVAAAEAQVATAEVQVATARAALDDTILRAPVAATIGAINGSAGEPSSGTGGSTGTTTAASAFVQLTDVEGLLVEAFFAEVDAAKIRSGADVVVTFDALPDVQADATVVAIDPTATISNSVVTYGVTARLESLPAGLRPGMTANVEVIVERAEAVATLPATAVTEIGGTARAIVRRNGEDETVDVAVGRRGGGLVEIVSGLAIGDVVVVPATSGVPAGFTPPIGGFGGGGGLGGGLGR